MNDYMFTLEEVLSACKGELYTPGSTDVCTSGVYISGVSKDTRTIAKDNLYIAIKGENFDGHDFIADAVSKGASAVLACNRSKVPSGVIAIIVEDTVAALGNLARYYRFKLGAKTVCVTGSVGKTSTREMIAAVLSSGSKCYSTKFNENNEIGMPMTILSAPLDTQTLVLELGMRLKGEISYLTNIACPDIAVITTVGYSHIERLGSQENIRDAKCEIIEGLVDGGILIVNGDDRSLVKHVEEIVPFSNLVASVSVSGHNSDLPAEAFAENIIFEHTGGVTFDANVRRLDDLVKLDKVSLKLNGIHNVRNALVALLCGAILHIPSGKAVEALGKYEQPRGRGQVHFTKRFIVIDDAYNASPESMEAAFGNLSVIGQGKRRIAVLGGMLELGDYAKQLHNKVGRTLGGYGFDTLFVTGDESDDLIEGVRQNDKKIEIIKCDNTADVKEKLTGYVKDGDVLLFKASHSFGFEKLAADFKAIGEGNE